MQLWQKHQKHDEEVKAILKRTGCMTPKGEIRSWRKEADSALDKAGHSSLSFNNCSCKNTP